MSNAQWNTNSTAKERQSLLAGPALVEPSRSATVDADFYAPKPPPLRYFCRTWTIGIFFGILALGITGAMYYWYIWLSIGFTVVLPFTVMFLAPVIFGCCYSGVPTTPEWKTTVRRVAMWGLLFGGLAGCIGGYFARELITIDALTPYSTVSSTSAPLTDLGRTNGFINGAAPSADHAGRGTAFGIYPVCVAPILEIPIQKAVSYWAVGTGSCCSPTPPTCDNWKSITGATRLYFMELYHNISAATNDAISNNNLVVDPNAIYVRWGDPVVIKAQLRDKVIYGVSIASGLGLIFMGWRSYKGPY